MDSIKQLLMLQTDTILPVNSHIVIEGGGVYKGYSYLITFMYLGYRCGYVALKDRDKAILDAQVCETPFSFPEIVCHGGVTFYGDHHIATALLENPGNEYWIGFDGAHFRDRHDIELAKKYFPDVDCDELLPFTRIESGRHRSYEYMAAECFGIIEQLYQLNKDRNGSESKDG